MLSKNPFNGRLPDHNHHNRSPYTDVIYMLMHAFTYNA